MSDFYLESIQLKKMQYPNEIFKVFFIPSKLVTSNPLDGPPLQPTPVCCLYLSSPLQLIDI
jgi:hypothetical protein